MTRYYFDCPIKAFYMMRNFGVEIYTEDGDFRDDLANFYFQQGLLTEIFGDIDMVERFYVNEESEHIFEQKKGDIGIQDDGDYIARAHDIEDFEDVDGTVSPSKYWTIIMRDNKLFFNPLIENND